MLFSEHSTAQVRELPISTIALQAWHGMILLAASPAAPDQH
jgi:hypothetical protein